MKEGYKSLLNVLPCWYLWWHPLCCNGFDEIGQADTKARKVEICERAHKIPTEQVGFIGQEIIFDPHICTADRY